MTAVLTAPIDVDYVYPRDYVVTGDMAHDVRVCGRCGCVEDPYQESGAWITDELCGRCGRPTE